MENSELFKTISAQSFYERVKDSDFLTSHQITTISQYLIKLILPKDVAQIIVEFLPFFFTHFQNSENKFYFHTPIFITLESLCVEVQTEKQGDFFQVFVNQDSEFIYNEQKCSNTKCYCYDIVPNVCLGCHTDVCIQNNPYIHKNCFDLYKIILRPIFKICSEFVDVRCKHCKNIGINDETWYSKRKKCNCGWFGDSQTHGLRILSKTKPKTNSTFSEQKLTIMAKSVNIRNHGCVEFDWFLVE